LGESRQKRSDGSVPTRLQLTENPWDPEKQRAQVKILYPCAPMIRQVRSGYDAWRFSILRRCVATAAQGHTNLRMAKRPNHKHWHGATSTTAMTHIAVSEALDGKAVTRMEHLTDDRKGLERNV
jgi:hypothetical protein